MNYSPLITALINLHSPPSLTHTHFQSVAPPHFSFFPVGRLLTLRRICLSQSQVSVSWIPGERWRLRFSASQNEGRAFFLCLDLTGAASEEVTPVSTTSADNKGMTTVASTYL